MLVRAHALVDRARLVAVAAPPRFVAGPGTILAIVVGCGSRLEGGLFSALLGRDLDGALRRFSGPRRLRRLLRFPSLAPLRLGRRLRTLLLRPQPRLALRHLALALLHPPLSFRDLLASHLRLALADLCLALRGLASRFLLGLLLVSEPSGPLSSSAASAAVVDGVPAATGDAAGAASGSAWATSPPPSSVRGAHAPASAAASTRNPREPTDRCFMTGLAARSRRAPA